MSDAYQAETILQNRFCVKSDPPVSNLDPNPVFLLHEADSCFLALAVLKGIHQSLLSNAINRILYSWSQPIKTNTAVILNLWSLQTVLFVNKVGNGLHNSILISGR